MNTGITNTGATSAGSTSAGGADGAVAPPPAAQGQGTPPAPGGVGKAVAIALAVVGGIVLLAAAFGIIRSAVVAGQGADESLTADATGVTALDIDAAASTFRIEFGDVDEARLDVVDARSQWTLTRDGDELLVTTRDGFFTGWNWGWDWGGSDEHVVLTLPERLQGPQLDAAIALAAGDLQADGAFGDLELELGAGSMDIDGSARALSVDVNAGEAWIDLAGVSEVDATVSAGRLIGELTGTAPRAVDIVVSAGSLDLTLPAETYAVEQDVSAGAFDNRLDTSSSSAHRVTVEVAAGSVALRSAGG